MLILFSVINFYYVINKLIILVSVLHLVPVHNLKYLLINTFLFLIIRPRQRNDSSIRYQNSCVHL
jgi:hypothetical protein